MCSEWETLHEGLARSIATKESERRFEVLKERAVTVARFDSAQSLIDYLAHAGGDLDEKDRILVELALAAREGLATRLAMALLLLGLWPGLDAVFARRARFWRRHAGDLAAEIVGRFTDQARRLNPARVHRVAATLVRSTERDVVRARMRDRRRRRCLSDVPVEAAEELTFNVGAPEEVPSVLHEAAELCPVAAGAGTEREIAMLRAWLAPFLGGDADLVIDAVVLNRPRQALGAERGIDERAARKRLQRALERLRRYLEAQIPVSRDGGEVAFAQP
jgi:RNA polymerase sigma-70 factor (ECF subfamily)